MGSNGDLGDGSTPVGAGAPRRILVVDDNRDAAEALGEALEMSGHAVEIAHDGPTAFTRALAFRPQLGFLDIGLPLMDGFALARQLRAHIPHTELKLVALTGFGQESDRRRTQEAGFQAHLVKPVDLDVLEEVIVRLCG